MERGYLVCDLFTGCVCCAPSRSILCPADDLSPTPHARRPSHGISTVFHHEPQISHTSDSAPEGVMTPGDCFTIEPSVEQLHIGPDGEVGGGDIWKDGWTVVTKVGIARALLFVLSFDHQGADDLFSPPLAADRRSERAV